MAQNKRKKALVVATILDFLNFERNDIKLLEEAGYEVHCAVNMDNDLGRTEGIHMVRHQIDFARSPFTLQTLTAYRQLKALLGKTHFDLIHCHTPVGGVLARIAARKYRKTGTRVIYTAHGFHFYKGAPVRNWLLYYPVEWLCSWWTDTLITINREDYKRAKNRLHAKKTAYIPGVGIDIDRFQGNRTDIKRKREELGLKAGDFMLLSVGELTPRKNHEPVIRAITRLANPRIKYFICGSGELREHLQGVVDELGIEANVSLLGYRTDVSELCDCADLFVFPSLQEELPVALMEAIASRTPVICSNIRGNTDLVRDRALFTPDDVERISEKISEYLSSDKSGEAEYSYRNLKKYDLARAADKMQVLYSKGEAMHLHELYECQRLRLSMGVPLGAKLLLSVGELNENKNHEAVIYALTYMKDKTTHYAIAGGGELRERLVMLVEQCGLTGRVHFLGYRTDVPQLYKTADLYIHPSFREGLPVALMEAIASNVPVICSDIRGNVDLVAKNATFRPDDIPMVCMKISEYLSVSNYREIRSAYSNINKYSINKVKEGMKRIYKRNSC